MENKSKAFPQDLQIEIMLRMPLKSLVKCICVSKKWASIIRSKQFKDLYLLRSMTRPRMLFGFFPILRPSLEYEVSFHSVYQEEKPLLSSGQQKMSFSTVPAYETSRPVRGLVCFLAGTEVVICNPGTNKFVTLPNIQPPIKADTRVLFLGYDEVTYVFKILCLKKKEFERSEGAEKHQVMTIGSGEESWRPVTCKYRHCPTIEGLCKGGYLYYVAWSEPDEYVVMKFNLVSEEFSRFKLPEVRINHRWKLVSYKGKIAAVNSSNNSCNDGVIEFWVLNEDTEKWSRTCIVIPCWSETVRDMLLFFKGTIGTGELVFASEVLLDNPFVVMYYNTVTKNLRSFEIESLAGYQYGCVQSFLDHVDSLLLM